MVAEREHPRFSLAGLVIGNVSDKNLQFSGTIALISLEGIGIYTREKVEKGMSIFLRIISFDGSNLSNYQMTGVVKNTECGILGVQFDQAINSKEYPFLYNYLVNEGKN